MKKTQTIFLVFFFTTVVANMLPNITSLEDMLDLETLIVADLTHRHSVNGSMVIKVKVGSYVSYHHGFSQTRGKIREIMYQ
jgi:hypothetical protein